MAHVILLVNAASDDKITLRWSDGAGWFDPYVLEKTPRHRFLTGAKKAREALKEMAILYLSWVDPNEQATREQNKVDLQLACARLAQTGHLLYRELFQLGHQRRSAEARSVEAWFRMLGAKGEIETLEIVI